jgi:hypothetical protein
MVFYTLQRSSSLVTFLSSEVFLALCLLVAVVAANIVLVFVLARRARASKVAGPRQDTIVAQKEERPSGRLFCTNCGAELPPESRFCIRCGTSSSDHKSVYQNTTQLKTRQPPPKGNTAGSAWNSFHLFCGHCYLRSRIDREDIRHQYEELSLLGFLVVSYGFRICPEIFEVVLSKFREPNVI